MAFTKIQAQNRVPGVQEEVVPNGGASGQERLRGLIIGQALTGSAMAAAGMVNLPSLVTSGTNVTGTAGSGSMLALQVKRWLNRYSQGELWVLPLADDPAAAAAAGTLALAGTAIATGTLPLYIDFQPVTVLVTAGMNAAQVATAVVTAAANLPDLPVTVAATSGTLTFTAKNKGLAGNDLDIRLAYYGTRGGEAVPAGITTTITPMSGGTQNPVLTAALLNLGDTKFEVIASSYSDPASLAALALTMDDNTGRWAPQRKIYGHVYAARNATVSAAASYGLTLNYQHITILPITNCPLSPPEQVADWAAAVLERVSANPSLPLQFMPTNIPPPPEPRPVFSDRQTLLFDGMSTYRVIGGVLQVERLVTTYQQNVAGVPDASYLDAETMHQLGYICRDIDAYLASKFFSNPTTLVADNVLIPGGSSMANPALIKATMDTRYRYLCDVVGVCQDAAGFAKESYVELAGGGRVNIYAPVRLTGQLRVLAVLVAFNKPT